MSADIGRDVERFEIVECSELVLVAPAEEPHHGAVIGRPRVPVADGGGEEFEDPAHGLVAGIGDDRRHHARRGGGGGDRGGRAALGRDQLGHDIVQNSMPITVQKARFAIAPDVG